MGCTLSKSRIEVLGLFDSLLLLAQLDLPSGQNRNLRISIKSWAGSQGSGFVCQ
jgi:hypothetical protein